MIERGGVAIQAAWDSGEHPAVNLPPIEFTKAEREYLFIAVLKALREPTSEMIAAAWDLLAAEKKRVGIARLGPGIGATEIYRAMIDTALAGEG